MEETSENPRKKIKLSIPIENESDSDPDSDFLPSESKSFLSDDEEINLESESTDITFDDESINEEKEISFEDMMKEERGKEKKINDNIKKYIGSKEWFQKLSLYKKNLYLDLLDIICTKTDTMRTLEFEEIEKYLIKCYAIRINHKPVPTYQQIMDLDINNITKNELLAQRNELDNYDEFSKYYLEISNEIRNKYELLNNPIYRDKDNRLRQIEVEERKVNPNVHSLKDRIIESEFDSDVKKILYDYYDNTHDEIDGHKFKSAIEKILSIPLHPKVLQNCYTDEDIGKIITKIYSQMNEKIYGLQDVKDEIACIMVNMLKKPDSKYRAFGLCGPPGIGKTMIGKIIADVLQLPFELISLGGKSDGSFINGFDSCYVGSHPGIIVESLIKMKCTNGVIFFDEIDKISMNHGTKDIEHSLLNISDYTQNHDFRDKFIPQLKIDLSKILFIYSMNSTDELDQALFTRIPLIRINGFSVENKLEMINTFLLKEICFNYDLDPKDIIIPTDVALYLISNTVESIDIHSSNKETGVRNLKNNLDRIIKRINLYKLLQNNETVIKNLDFQIKDFKIPYILSKETIDSIIKKKSVSLSYFT